MNEIMTANTKNILNDTNNTFGNEMLDNATKQIKNNILIANRSIFSTAIILNDMKSNPVTYFTNTDFKSLEDYGSKIFGFKKAYIYKLCQICRFVSKDDNGIHVLTDCDGIEYNVSQLIEMIPLSDKMIADNAEMLDAGLTCKDLRENVKKIVNPSIETTASETDNKKSENESKDAKLETDVDRVNKILEIVANIENAEAKDKLISFMSKWIKSYNMR